MSINLKKTTFWNFFYTNLRTVISIANGVLIIPLYLHYINSPLFGAWLATGNVMTWLSIADPGVGDVLLQKVANALGRNDKDEIGLAVTSGFLISIISFLVVIILGMGTSYYIIKGINYTGPNTAELVGSYQIAFIGTCLSMFANTPNNILIGFQKTKEFGFYATMISLSSILLNVVLLVLGYGLYSLAYAFLFRGVVGLGYSLIYCYIILKRQGIPYHLDKKYTKSLSSVFVYTFGGKVFNAVSGNIDLVIISRFLGPQAVILLELSRRPIKIVTGFVNNISIASLPALSHLSGSDDMDRAKKVFTESILVIIWVSGFIIGGFLLFNAALIRLWAGQVHFFGKTNNIFSCFSFYFLSITFAISTILYSFGDIKKNNVVTILRNLLYLVVVVFLVKWFGITGEIMAFLFSIILLNCTYYPIRMIKLAKFTRDEIVFFSKELIYNIFFLGVCAVIGWFLPGKLSWLQLIADCAVYGVVFFLYYYFLPSKFKLVLLSKLKFKKQKLSLQPE
jgi:O-antigen/teichoic acid export membrane protein